MKADAAFATALLAEAEKCRAKERCEYTKMICSPDLQQYLATLGSEAVQHFAEDLTAEERKKRAIFDKLVLAAASKEFPADAQTTLDYMDGLSSQSFVWKYMNLVKASAKVSAELDKYHAENRELTKKIEAKSKEKE